MSAPQSIHGQLVVDLQDASGNVRPVIITQAVADYAASSAPDERIGPAGRALQPGTDVRIRAQMDAASGEWTASQIEVIPDHAAHFDQDYVYDGQGPARVRTVPPPSNSRRTI